MNLIRKSILVLAGIACTAASAHGQVFNNSADVNVLRPYAFNTSHQPVLLVHETQTTTGSLVQLGFGNDGSQKPDGWHLNSSQSGTETFTLPGPVTVGSYRVPFLSPGNAPGSFVLEGFVSGVWTNLATVSSAVPVTVFGTFAPQTVTALRYTVTGLSASAADVLAQEVKVFKQTGQSTRIMSGYDYLHDVSVTASASNTGGPWTVPTGAGSSIFDGDYGSGIRNLTPGTVSFATLQLGTAQFMNAMNMGFFNGQDWTNGFSIYTSNAFASLASATSTTQALATATPASIQSAGWISQFSTNSSTVNSDISFGLANEGSFKSILIVWNGTPGGNLTELEVLAIPEPASLALLSAGGLLILRRRR